MKVGHDVHTFEWGERSFTIRSLSTEDEVYVFNRAPEGYSTNVSRLWQLRLYFAALSITEIDGLSIYEACFGDKSHVIDDKARLTLCNTLLPVLSSWGGRTFRWFFKYIWSWNETRGLEFVEGMKIEELLTPEEASIYAELKAVEAIEGTSSELGKDFDLEGLSDALNSEDRGD